MVNDLAATLLCVGFFIYLLDKIRFSNWENARRIAIESNEKVKEAESESKAKSQFLAAMSHEIRTPMNGVLGMTQLLQSTELQPQQRQYVEVIANSGKALLNIINDILDYSKIEAGKMDLESIDFDLDKLCLDVVSIFSLAAEKKQLQLLSSVEPGTPLCIRSDPTRLRQILLNLLGNAFKFTSEGGVSLRVGCVEVNDSENTVRLKFEVSDSGIGMTPEQMGNLFQAFQQADVSTARKYGGTGLGLSISKSLSEYMGGEIGVVSEAGKGSTFWFTICCQTANPEFVQKHVLKADSLSGRRLLVADDSTEFAQIIEEQARAWGMNVDVVFNGEQALSMIEEALSKGAPYAVVLLDLSMPVCTGIMVGETMQADSRMRDIPRVLMTARRSLPRKEELAAIGFHDVMQKPFSSHYLKRYLLSALSELHAHDGHETTKIESHASLVGRKVLVAEDNSVNQMVIRSMLKKLGVEGIFVLNGRDALDYYRRAHQQFELVFMDCEMPEMDGFEATRLIREWEKQNGLSPKPIVALTAHAMKEHRDLCARVGMDDHLSKPIEIDQLRETLLERLGPPKAGATLH
jgi:signal transduction histidine kinase/DNA-binding response OmpR family regulator